MEKKNKVPTLEEVWATLEATAANIKEWSAESKVRDAEWAARFKKSQEEADKRAAEADRRAAEADRRAAEAAKRDADADERLKKLEILVGNVSNNNGFYAEDFFQRAFAESLELAGIKFDDMIPNLRFHGKENGDFDIVLVNGDSVAIIEVKYRIHPNYVETLVTEKLQQFRKHFPTYNNHAVYLGIAGLSFSERVIKDAKEHGVAIIRQDGQKAVVDSLPTKTY
jgi:hypothetical protein